MSHSYFRFILVWLFFIPVTAWSDQKPNVIVILADDQGWGDLSMNGNINLNTPRIDSLAREGVIFDRFYVCPVCSPTRAEFLTGRYHPRTGVFNVSTGGERMDLDETTIADTFRAAGYATGAFGKWHNGMQYPYHPNGRGFDEYYGFCSGHWGHYFSPMLEHNGKLITGNGYITDDFTDMALAFMHTQLTAGKPFFAYLPYCIPHSPMQVPDTYWERFANKKLNYHHRDPGKEDIGHTRAALAMCENIDWNVGRILDQLDGWKIADNTIVVYFSDNGPNGWRWNGGMKGRKGSTDEGGVRVPMIIRWPGHISTGQCVKQIAGAIDLLPTLTELAGINLIGDKPLDGLSLAPLLRGTVDNWPERMIFSHWNDRVSVRTQQYRLDQNGNLYDMLTDSGQKLVVNDKFPEVAKRLQQEVVRWRQEVLAELDRQARPFTVGHPDFIWTQLPARDAIATGEIKRSSIHPNCSYFTNWKRIEDTIHWPIEVLQSGDYEIQLYYTCPAADIGSTFEVSFNGDKLYSRITQAHEPPVIGAEQDRTPRTESYVKDFKPVRAGLIHLEKGIGDLMLRALEIPGNQVFDLRLVMLKYVR